MFQSRHPASLGAPVSARRPFRASGRFAHLSLFLSLDPSPILPVEATASSECPFPWRGRRSNVSSPSLQAQSRLPEERRPGGRRSAVSFLVITPCSVMTVFFSDLPIHPRRDRRYALRHRRLSRSAPYSSLFCRLPARIRGGRRGRRGGGGDRQEEEEEKEQEQKEPSWQ